MNMLTASTAAPITAIPRAKLTVPILVAAFLIQAAILFMVMPALSDSVSPEYGIGFGDLYDLIANNLLQGNGYRIEANMGQTMMREPGYPLFLVCVFKIGGYHIETARLANLLLAVGIAFLMLRLTRRITGDELTAVVATLLFLLYPGTIIAEARGGVEIIFIFVVMLFMLALHHAVGNGLARWYFVAGLALGMVVLVRSTPLLFPLFLFVFLLFVAKGAKERIKLARNTAILVLGMALVMSPWVIRNYMLVHKLVPAATVAGVAAQEGQYTCRFLSNATDFRASQREAARARNELAAQLQFPFEGWYYQYFFSPGDEEAFNKTLLQRVAKQYGADPELFARCIGKNLLNFWFLGKTWHATWLNAFMQVPLLILAFSGIHALWRRGLLRETGIILTFVLYIIAVQVPIIAHARHSIPLVPFLAILASVSLVALWRAYRAPVARGTRA